MTALLSSILHGPPSQHKPLLVEPKAGLPQASSWQLLTATGAIRFPPPQRPCTGKIGALWKFYPCDRASQAFIHAAREHSLNQPERLQDL
jgi:hypothetical protein